MSKYTPLKNYLCGLPSATRDVTLTFSQIEKIIYDKLPASAYRHSAWWANERDGNHVHAHSWLDAGWQVDCHDRNARWVRFKRQR